MCRDLEQYSDHFAAYPVIKQNITSVFGLISLKQVFHGKNVYGILRAPRAPGTEAVVLAAPFRPPDTEDRAYAGIALMLGLAKAFRSE